MNYSFNVEVANKVGVEKAVLIENIAFWIRKNKANEKNFYDGRFWTFNSSRALVELFPFWNSKKIQRMLKALEDEGILLSGNFNKNRYDQTKWYTIIDPKIGHLYSIDCSKVSNEMQESVQPIPDINTDINTDKNIITHPAVTDREREEKRLKEAVKESFYLRLSDKTIWSWPKEGAAIKKLVEKGLTKDDPDGYLQALLAQFHHLVRNGNNFWQGQPFLPSTLNSSGIYARVVAEMEAPARGQSEADRQFDEIAREVLGDTQGDDGKGKKLLGSVQPPGGWAGDLRLYPQQG